MLFFVLFILVAIELSIMRQEVVVAALTKLIVLVNVGVVILK